MSRLCLHSSFPTNEVSPRATPYAFIGYPPHIKGYNLCELSTKRIFISRDVIFHEYQFPFYEVDHIHLSSSDPFNHISLPNMEDNEVSNGNSQISSINPSTQTISSIEMATVETDESSRTPSCLRDFHCNPSAQSDHNAMYPLSKQLSNCNLIESQKQFVVSIS